MNTPSKEALEAANYIAELESEPMLTPALTIADVIDRHFAPLRRRAEQAEARVKELEALLSSEKATRNAIIAKGLAAEQRNAELEAEYRDLRVAYEQNASQCVQLNRELGLKIDTVEWLNGTAIQRDRAEKAEARVKELEAACAELVTDGNAITLAANLARQSERVKELEVSNSELRESHAAIHLALATREADCSKWPDQIRALRADNAELQKQEAESRRLFYAEQDKRQSAEFRCEELAGALREARHLIAEWESADGEPATELLRSTDAALARHAACEPAIDSLLAVTPAYTTEMRGRLQKAADAVDAGEPEAQK